MYGTKTDLARLKNNALERRLQQPLENSECTALRSIFFTSALAFHEKFGAPQPMLY